MTLSTPCRSALLFGALVILSACVSSTPEARWTREEGKMVRYEGSTSEPSCSGTCLQVFVDRDQKVRHLDWTMEMSTRFIRREYYFVGETPSVVVETTHAKFDSHGEFLATAHQISKTRHELNPANRDARAQEFLEHSRFLIRDFKAHRKDYLASGPADPG